MAFPDWAKNIIRIQVRGFWENLVNGDGVNTNNVPISTKMRFVEAGPGADIKIKFDVTYPTNAGGGMGTFPVENISNFDSMGNYTGPPLPGLPGDAPQGGRDRVLAFWTPSVRQLTFNSNIDWYQTPNDGNANNGGMKFDFHSVALHEWGHVLGLDHPGGAMVPAANIMTGAPQLRRMAGNPQGINHAVDAGSRTGAQNLYTIALQPNPCPPTCGDGDSCCPSGCDAENDSDCAALLPLFSPAAVLLLSGLMVLLASARAARRRTTPSSPMKLRGVSVKHFATRVGAAVLFACLVVPVAQGGQTSTITINPTPMPGVNGVHLTIHFYQPLAPQCPQQPMNCKMQAGLICSTGMIPCNANANVLAAAIAGDINTACNGQGIQAVANGNVVTTTAMNPFWCCVADDNDGAMAWPLDTCSPLKNICNGFQGDETLPWVAAHEFTKAAEFVPMLTTPDAFALLPVLLGLTGFLFLRHRDRAIVRRAAAFSRPTGSSPRTRYVSGLEAAPNRKSPAPVPPEGYAAPAGGVAASPGARSGRV